MTPAQDRDVSTSARRPPENVVVGRILRPHGVRGDLLVDFSPQLAAFISVGSQVLLGPERDRATVAAIRPHGRNLLLSVVGVATRTEAERWRGQAVQLPLDDVGPLPPGVYFHWQILGLEVQTEEGERLGRITEILETGANDVYVVEDEAGSQLLLPAIEAVIRAVDLGAGRMTVFLLPGLRD